MTKEADHTKNTKNTREITRGNTKGNTRETLKPTSMITHVLDPPNTKGYTIQIKQRTIQEVTGSSP